MCAAHTILLIPYYHISEKDTNTTHCYSASIVVFIVLTCVVGQTMTGSHQTRSSGQVRTSPRRNKVVKKTEKVRTKLSNTSESRRNLNGRSRGREIAARPYPKVNVASDNVACNSEVEEMDVEEDNHLRQPMRRQIVSSTEGAMKKKKRPGNAGKTKRVPEVHGSTYDDDTDNGNDDDGKLLAD